MSTLSILIPTHDGDGLDRCLASLLPQLAAGDEVIVCWDTHDGRVADDARLIWCSASPHYTHDQLYIIEHDARHHCYGHCQLNEGITWATGDYLVFQDDDDVFADGALAAIRAAIDEAPGQPLMFRFVTHYRLVLWAEPRVAEGWVGGHGFVPPNQSDKLGLWTCRYEGDYDFITSTLAHYPEDSLVWREDVISVARPDEPSIWFCLADGDEEADIVRRIRNQGRAWMTRYTSEITPEEQAAWWAAREALGVRVYLALIGEEVLGFGLLRRDPDGRLWATLAVREQWRGRGVGTQLYRYLCQQAGEDVWIEVRADNAASLRAAQKAGFEFLAEAEDGICVLLARQEGQ